MNSLAKMIKQLLDVFSSSAAIDILSLNLTPCLKRKFSSNDIQLNESETSPLPCIPCIYEGFLQLSKHKDQVIFINQGLQTI